jgi:hypothetical protein
VQKLITISIFMMLVTASCDGRPPPTADERAAEYQRSYRQAQVDCHKHLTTLADTRWWALRDNENASQMTNAGEEEDDNQEEV